MINRLRKFVQENWSFTLYSLVPVLSLYNNNIGEVPISALVRPLLLLNAITLFVISILKFIVKNHKKANALAQTTLLFLFSSNFYELLHLSPYFHLLIATILIVFVFVAKQSYVEVYSTLVYRAFMILAVVNVFYFVYGSFSKLIYSMSLTKKDAIEQSIVQENQPDIYLIALDGHAREDVLKNQYDYDLTGFLSELEKRGFYIQRDAITNYGQTHLAISSLLEMDYLNPPEQQPVNKSDKVAYSINILKTNKTFSFFNSQNYKIFLYSTGWVGSLILSEGPWDASMKWTIGEFEYSLMYSSVLYALLDDSFIRDVYRGQINFVFNDISNVAKIKGPTFTYAHILSPHPPFVFGEGNENKGISKVFTFTEEDAILNGKDGSQYQESYKESYKSQLTVIDNKILKTLDKILSDSPKPPVIILMSDHGPAASFTYDNLSAEGAKERYSVLRAVYFPDRDYSQLFKTKSHINVFWVNC